MRPYAIALIQLALVACGSTLGTGGPGSGMTCNLNNTTPCYSSDCKTIVWCSMIKDQCSEGYTLSACLGRDAGPDQQPFDGGPACVSQTPPACYSTDCSTVLSNPDCADGGFAPCPSGQRSYLDCFGGDSCRNLTKSCRDADGGLTLQICQAGIMYCPPGTVDITVDAGPGDTTPSDGGDGGADGAITCPTGLGAPCYSSDCSTIVSCSDVALCPAGTRYWGECFGAAGAAN